MENDSFGSMVYPLKMVMFHVIFTNVLELVLATFGLINM